MFLKIIIKIINIYLVNYLKEFSEWLLEKSDPKVGTGKKPKGSSRRLYTDENPKDTVSVKFRTLEDIRITINSQSFKSKSHKRQSQILNLIEQRVRVAHRRAKDPHTKKRLKRAHDYIKSKCEASKEKTKRLNESNTSDEVIQTVKDILLPINDMGYNVSVNLSSSEFIIRVVTYVDKPLLLTDEIREEFMRMRDYLESEGYDSVKVHWISNSTPDRFFADFEAYIKRVDEFITVKEPIRNLLFVAKKSKE